MGCKLDAWFTSKRANGEGWVWYICVPESPPHIAALYMRLHTQQKERKKPMSKCTHGGTADYPLYHLFMITMIVPAWTLLESKNKAIKVVVAVWGEQDVQEVPRAFYWRRQLIPAKPANHRGVQIAAVTHLDIVIATVMVRLKTELWKPEAWPRRSYG